MSPKRSGASSGTLRVSARTAIVLRSVLLLIGIASLTACRGPASDAGDLAPIPKPEPVSRLPIAVPYTVSAQGGTPATGPGSRYNHCERIWCLVHKENYAIDHYLRAHVGWILHDDAMGDVFVPTERISGPTFPRAKLSVLRLCGEHVHPFSLARGGGAVRDGMYTYGLGYNRTHFRKFGTRLEPCCVNGVGWDYVHSGGRFFRFHDLDEYREHPERGWQAPFPAAMVAGADPR